MDKLIYTAMSGAKATMAQQAAVANNLANTSTTGFRSELHRFRAVEVQSPAAHTRAFVVDANMATDYRTGPLQRTGGAYDVAVVGSGMFAVQAANGSEAYTRNGNFTVDSEGVMRTQSGLTVVGDSGPIAIPPDNDVEIAYDGTITAVPRTGARNAATTAGRLKLVNPAEADLRRGEDGLFRTANGAPAQQDEAVKIASGYVEGSNVNIVEQMVNMISLGRHFEMQTKLLSTAQEDDKVATQIIAR
ncbi:flagellar basal-body rod protein FlgF [Uliginosibacterium sp. H3]|uniref:Flagellar basal-body rod protein FlgF n=1 Tax=Uliginosibacterium silvisoli TaxID=3114758 RepID=A0ABU6K705_9RHOO|nr:flagellar basal-body rod protein FlgF [Uliginosibacterium sp. H3]